MYKFVKILNSLKHLLKEIFFILPICGIQYSLHVFVTSYVVL